MTSLLDIGPLTEEVPVGGSKSITVYGVTPEGFFFLLEKFPVLQDMFANGQEVNMEALRKVAPESIAYVLAVATTSRAYMTQQDWLDIVEATANVALNLNATTQMALFQAALRLTFPDGIGPFIAGVEALTASINRVTGETVQPTTSSKPLRSGFATDSRGMRLGQARRPASSTH